MATPKKNKKAAKVTVGGVLLVGAVLAAKFIFGIDLLDSSEKPQNNNPKPPAQREVEAPQERPEVVIDNEPETTRTENPEATKTASDESALRLLIDNEISGEMVLLENAEIVKVLADDDEGSRHQRLLLKLETGGTVLVAHNIDLAHRVPVEDGDRITIYGQYEWNDRGGVLHWTHHAPRNNREGGWIEFDGKRYQ